MNSLGISVVVCCYNSAERLEPTLKHLAAQRVSDFEWEVLVIDNASTDNTQEMAIEYWRNANGHGNFRVLKELSPGLSHARKRGIDEAKFDFVLFCDDDNWLNPEYLNITFQILFKNPEVGIVGGCGEPVFEGNKPSWFDKFEKTYAVGKQANENGIDEKRRAFYGASMAMRKDLIKYLYDKNVTSLLSDRKGNELVSGGDTEICYWYKKAGYRFYYEQSLTFKHYIPANRLTFDYLIKRGQAKGKTEALLLLYKNRLLGLKNNWLTNPLLWLFGLIKGLVLSIVFTGTPNKSVEKRMMIAKYRESFQFRLKNRKALFEADEAIKKVFLDIQQSGYGKPKP